MTMQITAIRLPELSDSVFHLLVGQVSDRARVKIHRYKHQDDAKRSLIADILVRTLLCSRLNVNNRELIFGSNEFGKPHLTGAHSLHYNLSHSGQWIVCAIDYSPIGADVERINPIDLQIAERFFTDRETIDLLSKPLHERLSYFYDLWTLKESYIKAIGKGLSIPLDSFSICLRDRQFNMQCANELPIYYFKQYVLEEGYKFSVCSEHSQFATYVEVLECDKLLEHFRRHMINL